MDLDLSYILVKQKVSKRQISIKWQMLRKTVDGMRAVLPNCGLIVARNGETRLKQSI